MSIQELIDELSDYGTTQLSESSIKSMTGTDSIEYKNISKNGSKPIIFVFPNVQESNLPFNEVLASFSSSLRNTYEFSGFAKNTDPKSYDYKIKEMQMKRFINTHNNRKNEAGLVYDPPFSKIEPKNMCKEDKIYVHNVNALTCFLKVIIHEKGTICVNDYYEYEIAQWTIDMCVAGYENIEIRSLWEDVETYKKNPEGNERLRKIWWHRPDLFELAK